MKVSPKDQKILWSRAMGRCSMCRKKLVVDASEASPSRATLVGEICHIVGEKESSPRGKSILSKEDRNRYPNLVLLCLEHHKIIDDDPTEWPIERLHQLKSDHELWVERLVPEDGESLQDAVYARIVNRVTDLLLLDRWPWLSDHVVRSLVPEKFIDGIRYTAIEVKKAVWPRKYPELESALRNVADRGSLFADAFLGLAYLDDHGFYRADKPWRRATPKDLPKAMADVHSWEGDCSRLFANLVHALNEYASTVRATLRPSYFLHEGKFFILDSLGVTNQLQGKVYFPDTYQ